MADLQDVIQLPVRFFDPTDPEGMALAVQRNFLEVERYLSLLQGYIKQISGGAVSGITDKGLIWDRASNINPDGTFPVEKLSDKLIGLQHELQLADAAVTAAKIAVGAIQTLHIEAGAITLPKTSFPYHQIY